MKSASEAKITDTKQVAIIFVVGLVFMGLSAFLYSAVGNLTKKVFPTEPVSKSAYELKDSMKSLVVIENYKNTVANHKASKPVEVPLKVSGHFSKGFLYVVADVEGDALRTEDDDNYDAVFASLIELTPNGDGGEYGGHLIPERTLPTRIHEDKTELLYSLASVPYKGHYLDSNVEITEGNWLEVLNDTSKREEVYAFSSTEKGTGTIQKLVIYYECAEGSNCSITAQ